MSLLDTSHLIVAHTVCAHEDDWVESHPAMDFSFPSLQKHHPLVVQCNQLLRCVFVHVIWK